MLHRLLPRTSLRDPSTRRVLDLGVLYNSLYRFWLHRGAWGLTLHSLVSVLNCFALWIFSFAFFFMVDWTLVTSCVGDECGKRSLLHSPSLADLTGRQSFLSLCFLLSCAASLGYELKQFIEVTCIASELHRDLRQYVKVGDRTPFHGVWYRARAWMWGAQGHSLIPDTRGDEEMSSFTAHDEERVGRVMLDIDDVTWDDFLHHVIVRIIRKDSGVSNRQQVDELRVVQTMLVVENYLVALHSHHFFRRGSVLWWANQAVINELVRAQFSFGRLLDVDRAVEESLAGLRLGLLLSILLYPLVVSFFFAKLLVRYVAVTRSNPRYLVEHEWTPEALWAFRLYNELPHLYDHRIRSASTKFNDVLDSVAPPSVFSRFPRRAAEIFILLLVIVGIVNGTVITTGNFGGRAVVWWLSVGLVIYGTTASTTRAREATHRTSAYFDAVSTLYYEDATWRQSTAAFRDCISRHFLWPRALVALREFFSILLMPVVVCMLYTRGEAELRKMAIFLEENSVWVDGVGHVCSLAAFDTEPAAGMVSTNDLDDVNDSLDGSANGSGDVTPPQDNSAVHATVPRDERGYSAVGETSSSGRQLVHHLTTALHANLTKIPIPRALGGRGVAKNGAEPTMERVDSTDDAVAVINMKTPRPAAPDVTKFNLTSSARDALRSVVPSNKGAEERNSPPVGDAYDVFIGAIEADTVPAAIAAQKQHVSLVQFAAVHSHWAHHASQYGKTQVVRDLAAIVASTDPSASPEPRCTASRVTMTSHDVAHWHIAHYAAAATAATPRTQTSSPAPPPIRVTTTIARDSDDEERP